MEPCDFEATYYAVLSSFSVNFRNSGRLRVALSYLKKFALKFLLDREQYNNVISFSNYTVGTVRCYRHEDKSNNYPDTVIVLDGNISMSTRSSSLSSLYLY